MDEVFIRVIISQRRVRRDYSTSIFGKRLPHDACGIFPLNKGGKGVVFLFLPPDLYCPLGPVKIISALLGGGAECPRM